MIHVLVSMPVLIHVWDVGHDGRVETKLLSTSTLCKVRLRADKKACSFSAGVGKGA